MSVLVSPSDFIGKWAIPTGINSSLTSVIADKEEDLLIELLGADLYAEFKTKLPVSTMPNPYKYIYDPFAVDFNEEIIRSKGMKTMLLNFIWFFVMREIKFKATPDGIVVNDPDSSKATTTGNLYTYYNDAIDTYKAIQHYIYYVAPTGFTSQFNGKRKQSAIPTFG